MQHGAAVLGLVSAMPSVIADGLVDALLLDSGNQKLAVKELGGTGRTHDWTLSRRIRDLSGVPVFLAGGSGLANVVAAVQAVQPHGHLDAKKPQNFFAALVEYAPAAIN